MPENQPITLRLDPKLTKKLDKLAEATQRSRTFLLTEAVKDYLSINEWQIEEIQKGLQEADAGDFATDEEVEQVFKKYRRRAG
ncbi:transcriptional regulator, CopG family [Candidatus Koribacter versatilis Ellin345]|uniref:Transcriptional regulator, CopG family n=1 Tax=Koribacter versatilis (strain Ellin345) TaxID=204669 RepID=Q1IKP2_KORVE|nr:CopG family ribbon-helix-helix protein [Candidatus Koribacter versatilis]ABF42558.1 transcriptional regulator, CopG family [Candidatus Koribacter versatilis Ellin345]